ncbi:hypothetical protein PO124_12785 [Bacillus licheniformis]|nr:hypothetical protein [Bacillus licheniformis]
MTQGWQRLGFGIQKEVFLSTEDEESIKRRRIMSLIKESGCHVLGFER